MSIYVNFLTAVTFLLVLTEYIYSFDPVIDELPDDTCHFMHGDVYIGGLVNMHRLSNVTDDSLTFGPIQETCSDPYEVGLFTSLSIMYAVNEINAGTFLDLKNVTLGYKITDSCRSRTGALRGSIILSSHDVCGNGSLAVIADTFSSSISPVAHYLQLTTTPLIAVFSTSVEFTNTELYPTFFRTVPNDNHQSAALVDIVVKFGWTWVGVIATDENYGRLGIENFKKESLERSVSVCVAFEAYVPTPIDNDSRSDVIDLLQKNPKAKVIITFVSSGEDVRKLFEECDKQNVTKRVWIGTDVWIISREFAGKEFYNVIDAAIGTSIEEIENENFTNFFLSRNPNNMNHSVWLSEQFNEFWESMFSCKLYNDVDKTDVNEICWAHSLDEKADELRTFVNFTTYDAVYAIGYAIADILDCTPPNGLLENGSCPDINNLQHWQLMRYLKNVNFSHHIVEGRRFVFDKNYEVLARYSVFFWNRTAENKVEIRNIGIYDESIEPHLELNTLDILFDGGNSKEIPMSVCSLPCPPGTIKLPDPSKPNCCFDCVNCSEDTISIFGNETQCTECSEDSRPNDNNTECLEKPVAVVQWTDPVAIGFLIWSAVGCCLTFVTIGIFFIKRDSEVVKSSSRELSLVLQLGIIIGFLSSILFLSPPTDAICQLRISIPSIISCLLLAVFLIRIYMVIKIFNRGNKGKSMANLKIRLKRFRLLFVFAITSFQILIVIVAFFTFPVKKIEDNKSLTKETILECDTTINTYISNEFFNLILIIVCFVLAFRARKMPHNYHEARFISIVMTFWIIIFLISIPTHLYTVGELQSIIAVMFILILYTLILVMLLLRKCYILFAPQMNNTGAKTDPNRSCTSGLNDGLSNVDSAIQDCRNNESNM